VFRRKGMITKISDKKVSPIAIEKIKKLNVLTDRVKKRRDERLEAELHVCSERSRLVTESWKETDGQPLVLRRAELFKKMLEGISITIRDGELVVGSQTRYIRGASPPVDFNPAVALEVIEKPRGSSEVVLARLSEEDRRQLLEDAEYWKGRSPGEMMDKMHHELSLEDNVVRLNVQHSDRTARRFLLEKRQRSRSAVGRVIDFKKVIDKGLNYVLGEIEEEIDKLDFADEESLQKYAFLTAGSICCKAVITFAHRYARLAEKLALKEKDPVRKRELRTIAENCDWVPANPARTFHEAVQCFWLLFLSMNLEAASHDECAGRLDQFLYTTYEKDIEEGRITRQEAAELLGCLWVKFNEMETINSLGVQQASMGSQFIDTTICGVTTDGKDATNELSFLILEVAGQMKMTQPPLYLRFHPGISEELMIKALEINRITGCGIPCFINDSVTLIKLTDRGIPLTEARDYFTSGCISVMLPSGLNSEVAVWMNTPKLFELALHNGIDPLTGKRMGPETGDPRTFKTYEELYDAFLKQCEYAANIGHKNCLLSVQVRRQFCSYPFTSILVDDCIKKGKDYYHDGVRYPQMCCDYVAIGHQNVADGLTAIKKLVFEEKKLTMPEILDALLVNFEGKEKLRQMLLTAPKYGNDDDYADEQFNNVSNDVCRIMAQHRETHGYPRWVMRGGGSGHYAAGLVIGALPDGRKAFEPTADGNLSPVQGMDVKGPTAVLLSATKVNQTEYAMTTLLNMKIMPSMVQTKEGIRKVISLIKTFFNRGGWHVQFNMIDQQTLLDAQKHPEQYKSLVVRVGGYSAYFVDLTPKVQNDIIARTQHSL
jgi:pyruvate formate-lyase/glycerol dehydratase family glycyl radical enzyme